MVNTFPSDPPPEDDESPGASEADAEQSSGIPAAKMTRNQLKRRAKIIDAVIEMISEGGAEKVQVRDVAQRSGVALATVYKYYNSREKLLAAAVSSWQERVVRPSLGTGERFEQDPVSALLEYLRRAQLHSYANPELTVLTLQFLLSTDPEAKGVIASMMRTKAEVLRGFLIDVAPEDIPHVAFGLAGALIWSLIGLFTDRMTLEESQSHVEWVAGVLLGEQRPRALD